MAYDADGASKAETASGSRDYEIHINWYLTARRPNGVNLYSHNWGSS
jgi:hypothetical protein